MLNKKEIGVILLAGIIIGYLYSFLEFTWMKWLFMSSLGIAIVAVHSFGQKIAARMLDSSTETSLWTMEQFGFKSNRKFTRSFPAGIFLPVFFIVATLGRLKFTAITTFEALALPRLRSFSKITERQLAMIALSGAIANVLVGFASFLMGYNDFAMMNLYFAFFNLFPLSSLDGMKIFFGSRLLWVFSFSLVIALMILFEVAGLWAAIISAVIIAIAILVAYYASFENF